MTSSSNPLRRSMARVEFLACMDSVESMLGQGFSKQLIHERLREEGRISMAYVTFTKFIAKAAKGDLHVASLRPAADSVTPPASKPLITHASQPKVIKAASNELQDPRTVDPKSVF